MPVTIYRRKGSLVWNYRGTIAGHRLRGSTRTSNKEAAADFASKVERDFYDRGLHGPAKALTFPKAAALYLAAEKPDRFIKKLVKHWGDVKVADMSAGAILQAAIDIYPTAGNATRNRQVIVPTQAIINHCAKSNLCPRIKVERLKFETKEKIPATPEWIDRFRAKATRPDIGALALFMFSTGARISEALGVEWKDIDFSGRTVLIRQTKLGNERRAHLPQNLFLALVNLKRKNKPFNFAGHSSALGAWERTITVAGIEPLTFHSCRHGFATTLLRRGVDVVTIAKLGGWKSPAHVFETYGHAQDDKTLTDRIFGTPADTASMSIVEDQ